MLFRFTAAGKSLFDTNPAAFNITRVVLTDAFNYTLADPPVALQGDTVYDVSGTLPKEAVGANTMLYTKQLDNTVGDFEFGEAGLYSGATLALVGVASELIEKTAAAGAENGNFVTLNAFASYNNVDSYGFAVLSNSDNLLAMGQVNHPDFLVPPYEGEPNAYVVNGLAPEDIPSIAFADRYGRWNFSSRPQRFYNGVVTGATTTAVDIATDHEVEFADASDYILQFTSGALRGYVRQLNSLGSTFFAWNTPTVGVAEDGDEFVIVGPQSTTITVEGQPDLQFKNEGTNIGTAGGVSAVDFVGTGVNAVHSGGTVTVTIPGSPSVQYQDEGLALGTAGTVDTVDFVGAPVTATRVGSKVTVTVAAPAPAPAAQAQIQFQEEGSNLGATGTVTTLNFVGAGATASRGSNTVTVTIPGAASVTPGGVETSIQVKSGSSLGGSSDYMAGDIVWDGDPIPTLDVGADSPVGRIAFSRALGGPFDPAPFIGVTAGSRDIVQMCYPATLGDDGLIDYSSTHENAGGYWKAFSGWSAHLDVGSGYRALAPGVSLEAEPGTNSGATSAAGGAFTFSAVGPSGTTDDAPTDQLGDSGISATGGNLDGVSSNGGSVSIFSGHLSLNEGATFSPGTSITCQPAESLNGGYIDMAVGGGTVFYLVPSGDLIDGQPQPNVLITGTGLAIGTNYTPSSSSANGRYGQIGWDPNFLYICVDNVAPLWKRVPLETF